MGWLIVDDRKDRFQAPAEVVELQDPEELIEKPGKNLELNPERGRDSPQSNAFGREEAAIGDRLKLGRDGHELGPSTLQMDRSLNGPTDQITAMV